MEDALGTNEAFEASDRQGTTGLDRVRVVPVLLIAGLLRWWQRRSATSCSFLSARIDVTSRS